MGPDSGKFVMMCVMLGIAAVVKVVKGLAEGVTGNAKMREAIKRLKEEGEAAERERLALANKAEEGNAATAEIEEEKNVEAAEAEETTVATEENQGETMDMAEAVEKAEEEEVPDKASMNERTWKCPQCGRINPTYQYACNCGNRFR